MILLRFRGSNLTKPNETKRNQTQPNETKQSLINSCRITHTHKLFFVSAGPVSPPSEPQYSLLLICNYMYVLTCVSPYWFFFSPLSLLFSLLENFLSLSLLFFPLYIHIYVHIYLCVSQGILLLSLSLSLYFSFILPFFLLIYK